MALAEVSLLETAKVNNSEIRLTLNGNESMDVRKWLDEVSKRLTDYLNQNSEFSELLAERMASSHFEVPTLFAYRESNPAPTDHNPPQSAYPASKPHPEPVPEPDTQS